MHVRKQVMSQEFKCIYCGGDKFISVDHWKVCPTCTAKNDPAFLRWLQEIGEAWLIANTKPQLIDKGKPPPRRWESEGE